MEKNIKHEIEHTPKEIAIYEAHYNLVSGFDTLIAESLAENIRVCLDKLFQKNVEQLKARLDTSDPTAHWIWEHLSVSPYTEWEGFEAYDNLVNGALRLAEIEEEKEEYE